MTIRTVTYDDAEWVLVPREPTHQMTEAAVNRARTPEMDETLHGNYTGLYQAMLAAVPRNAPQTQT